MDNKKRKYDAVDHSDLLEMIQKCIVQQARTTSSTTGTCNENQDYLESSPLPQTTNETRKRIIELKNQVSKMTQMISKLEETIDVELKGLYDTFSPLLSLGQDIVSHIMEFLDPEALHNAQEASYTLHQIIFDKGHWERLGKWCQQQTNQRPLNSNDIPHTFFHRPPPFSFFLNKKKDDHPDEKKNKKKKKEEDVVFAQARYTGAMSAKARYLETLAEKALPVNALSQGLTTSSYSSHRTLPCYDILNEDSCRKAFASMKDGQKLFVRLTHYDDDHRNKNGSSSTKLIWQGFLDWSRMNEVRQRCEFAASLDLHAIPNLDWPGLEDLLDLTYGRNSIRDIDDDDDDYWDPVIVHQYHSFFKCLQVTVLVNKDQILVASRGCLEAVDHLGHAKAFLRSHTNASLNTDLSSEDTDLRLVVKFEQRKEINQHPAIARNRGM